MKMRFSFFHSTWRLQMTVTIPRPNPSPGLRGGRPSPRGRLRDSRGWVGGQQHPALAAGRAVKQGVDRAAQRRFGRFPAERHHMREKRSRAWLGNVPPLPAVVSATSRGRAGPVAPGHRRQVSPLQPESLPGIRGMDARRTWEDLKGEGLRPARRPGPARRPPSPRSGWGAQVSPAASSPAQRTSRCESEQSLHNRNFRISATSLSPVRSSSCAAGEASGVVMVARRS